MATPSSDDEKALAVLDAMRGAPFRVQVKEGNMWVPSLYCKGEFTSVEEAVRVVNLDGYRDAMYRIISLSTGWTSNIIQPTRPRRQ